MSDEHPQFINIKLLTTQSKFINLCFISKRLIRVKKFDKKFNQYLATLFFKQNIDSCEIKSLFTFDDQKQSAGPLTTTK